MRHKRRALPGTEARLKAARWALLALIALVGGTQHGTLSSALAQGAAQTQPAPIAEYIHASWGKLQRSMTDCKSLVDPKTNTAPVLYLPHGMAEPAAVRALHTACGVQVQQLPKRIDHPGALRPAEIATPGLLYLPRPYIVPGGRFNEQYGWDSYFILLGLVQDQHVELARGMVENFFFEIENYGNLLNANRTYFLTRSQPPLLSSMIRMVYDADLKAAPQAGSKADAWLRTAYGYAVEDHALWLSPEHAAGNTGLARYHDLGEGPVPEMADASTYYPDIIHWFETHPEVKTNYLASGPDLAAGAKPTSAQAAVIARVSCAPTHSEVCRHAHIGSEWLTTAFYEGDRADRESGFDTTFRFGPFSGSADQYAPVCLNALLYKYELDLAWMAAQLGRAAEATTWKQQAAARRVAMDRYLWNPARGLYFDYNYRTHTQSTYNYITTYYPLWAGAASAAQAKAVAANLPLFLRPGGVAMSTTESGVQWDLPYGWAPTTYFAVAGLERAGADRQARTVADRFLRTVENGYLGDGTIREKYNVVSSNADVQVQTGYKQNVIGFGWTNGVFLRFSEFVHSHSTDAAEALGLAKTAVEEPKASGGSARQGQP